MEFKNKQAVDNHIFNKFSIKKSKLSEYAKSKYSYQDDAIALWFTEAEEAFEFTMTTFYKQILFISTNPLVFANTELRELNKFLETGKCTSVLFDDKKNKLETILNKQELFEYCRYLTTRDAIKFELDITRENFLKSQEIYTKNFSPEAIKKNLPKDDLIFTEDEIKRKNNLISVIDSLKGDTWFLARQAQCLFWIKDFFEHFISGGGFKKEPKQNQHQGFTVPNKEKIIPALHKALMDNKLIANIEEKDFKKAFLRGQGSIIWSSKGTHGKGLSGLGYFLKEVFSNGIIKSDTQIGACRIGAGIFQLETKEKPNAGSLNNSVAPQNARVIDEIVTNLKNL